jgi:hypothetical protein
MKKLLKQLNFVRVSKFNNRGWAYFGKVLMSPQRAAFNIKRSNWIYNLMDSGIKFKGTC